MTELLSLFNFASSAFFAFLGGIIPILLWLFFWTREGKEPRNMILLAFLGGIIAVIISLFLEKIAFTRGENFLASLDWFKPVLDWLKNVAIKNSINFNNLILVTIFAPFIEEISKFIMAFILVLRSKNDKWPIDPVILMITTALGFSALENSLFLMDPISKGNVITSIITGNLRFVGATLLHTISSATIGFFIGFNFFDKKLSKTFWTLLGIFCAIIIHTIFNFLMIGSDQSSFLALEIIWIAVIIVLLAFERIKKIKLEKIEG